MLIKSKNLFFRLASIKDSDFIYNLRLLKGKHLNNKRFTRKNNEEWISNYKKREASCNEYYFIIFDKKKDVGFVRIYNLNFKLKTFTWGSWVLLDGSPYTYPIISTLMIYSFAFDFLKMKESFFDVKNENLKVNSFHIKTGAKFLRKDKNNSFYKFEKNDYEKLSSKYKKYIGEVEWQL